MKEQAKTPLSPNTSTLYEGVGKKLRASHLAGKVSDKELLRIYTKNKKEADAFDGFGLTFGELRTLSRETHNPLLREKIKLIAEEYKNKSRKGNNQNKTNMQKLDFYLATALGLGLRGVMRELKKKIKTTGDVDANILLMLIETEFANLVAKKRHDKKEWCYARKELLLQQLSTLLYDNNWSCGLSYSTGKTASYVVFVYLPNGEQISFHTNDYQIMYYYDEHEFTWDGQACSTLEKLFTYVHEKYGIGCELTKFVVPSE